MVSGLGLLFEHDSSLVGPNLLKLYGTEDVLGDLGVRQLIFFFRISEQESS